MTVGWPAIREMAACLAVLKSEFQASYAGKSHVREVIPEAPSGSFPAGRRHLELLHEFARRNPIYRASRRVTVGGVPCVAYEGDANRYWLGSIGHAASRAPFSPTWVASAYVLSLLAREHGFGQVVDVGSGDGRIAFCAGILGMGSFSIEIDGALAGLQERLSGVAGFETHCADAAAFDYSSLPLESPAFAIGGIAQMGGASLARGVMGRVSSGRGLGRHGWVLTGTNLQKYPPDPRGAAGWGTMIEECGMRVLRTVSLPTAWTLGEPDGTPYVLAESANSNPN